jgi:hypothetical protein
LSGSSVFIGDADQAGIVPSIDSAKDSITVRRDVMVYLPLVRVLMGRASSMRQSMGGGKMQAPEPATILTLTANRVAR